MLSAFQAEIPDPLAEDLPELLPTGRMRTPAVGILLDVFIGENGFKGPAMQIQVQHIFGGKSGSGQPGDEQFVDHAIALLPNGWGSGCGGMSGDNQPHTRSTSGQGHVWTIVKGAGGSTFWVGTHLHGGACQNRLHHCQIQQSIVTAAPDDARTRVQDLSEHSSVAIQAIQTCAAVRGLISPVQPGRTRKEVLESPCLPGTERRKETQHAWKARVCVKALMQSYRKIRTPRLKLDCLKSNRQTG